MRRKVDWDDEENGKSEMKPFEEAGGTDASYGKQNHELIKDVLEKLPQTVFRKYVAARSHSMAAYLLVLDPT